MVLLTSLFAGFSVIVGAWFWWVVPRSPRQTTGVALFVAILLITYATGAELLSRVKPMSLELISRTAQSAEVIAYSWQEGVAIYLWLRLPDSKEPRAYAIPWSIQTMQQLQKGTEESGTQGMMMDSPFQWSWENRESPFYPIPQPKLPDKMGQPKPEIYDMPEQGI